MKCQTKKTFCDIIYPDEIYTLKFRNDKIYEFLPFLEYQMQMPNSIVFAQRHP